MELMRDSLPRPKPEELKKNFIILGYILDLSLESEKDFRVEAHSRVRDRDLRVSVYCDSYFIRAYSVDSLRGLYKEIEHAARYHKRSEENYYASEMLKAFGPACKAYLEELNGKPQLHD